MKKYSNLFRGFAGIFLALLIIVQIVATVANNWAGRVNELLGVSESTIERSTNPDDYRFLSDYQDPSDLIQAEIALNTRLAAEGSVVLKGTPAIDGTQVTLFGMRSGEKMQFGGSMGELTDASNVVTLGEAMEANGFSVNQDMVQFYVNMAREYELGRTPGGNVVSSYDGQGTTVDEVPTSQYNAADIGGYKDAAVVVLGRDAGESCCFYPGLNGLSNPAEFSNSPTGNILSLSNDERDLINYVKGQGFSKIVVLLNSSTSMEIEELKQDSAIDSIIWIGNPGAYGTYGIAKLLSGEVLPSGHLPDTFAVNSALSPAAQNFGIYTFANTAEIETTTNHALRADWYLVEAEGIYTGYKYYETRFFDSVVGQGNASVSLKGETADGGNVWDYYNEVSYPFGYGLEGSSFSEEITNANIDWSGETDSTVTVKVTNTGSVAAKHAVQLYVSVPYTDNDRRNGVEKSAIQLIGYAKTGESSENTFEDVVLLEPGKSEDVTITFNAQDFYSYDTTYAHDGVTGAYVLEAGDYCFATGNGAHEAVQAVLKELRPDLMGDVQPTGAAHKESLSTDTYLTQSNGATVQNQLGMADLNQLNCGTSVTYLTRSDWANTFPESVNSVTATADMISMLRNETYNAQAALADYDGPTTFTYEADNGLTAASLVGLDYDDPLFDKVLDQMSLQDLVNQYIAYLEELPSIAMPKENGADSPLGIVGTIGQRSKGSIYEVAQDDPAYGYHTNVYVGEPTVAATFSPLLQREEGRLIGNDGLWTGYNNWNGPGMNIHRTPYNGRNVGYYSKDSVLTGMASMYLHQGLVSKGMVTFAKHFAFNDQETNRDGIAVFLTEQGARENELRGFQIPIRSGSARGIMSAFNRVGCTYVGADTGLMNGILRGEWGFNGQLITDSVKSAQYFLPREALLASNGMMLGGSNNGSAWNFTADSVKDDVVIQGLLRESYHRKLFTYVNGSLLNGVLPESNVGGGVVWWVLMFRILGGLFLIGFAAFFGLFLVNEWKEHKKNWNGLEITTGIAALVLMAVGTVLFAMSYTTGYYTFGQMQSGVIAALLGGAIVFEIAALTLRAKLPDAFWPKLLTFAVIGTLAGAAALIVGDRVEGIGNCIVTDYDSGHGGEEAIYMSLAGAILMLIAIVYKIIGSFSKGKDADTADNKDNKPAVSRTVARNVGFGVSAVAVLLAVLIPTYTLVNPAGPGGPGGSGTGGTYTVTFNAGNDNLDNMPDYQFLGSNLKGIMKVESRLYVDITLTLDGSGNYTLFSDTYTIEAGKRTEIGDDTGLGMVIAMNAEGTYTENGDGTITTSIPSHAVFELQTDTYSAQMKSSLGLDINGSSDDGVYDSNDEPAVLDFVPETIWTLSDGAVVTYRDASAGGGVYKVSYNQNNGNTEGMPSYQFLAGDLSGMARADARIYIDETLTLDGNGNFTLFTEAYVIEAGKKCEVGDDTGLGMVLTTNASGTYTDNGDGTVTTAVPSHASMEMAWDTYSSQMQASLGMNVDGETEGSFDSDANPSILDFMPETVWTLSDGAIVTYEQAGEAGSGEAPAGDGLEITSDDGGTSFTFYADGTYRFFFASYSIEDKGTYTYENGVLTVTDVNGKEMTAEGDPLKLHYEYSNNSALNGDYTIPASDLEALLSGGGESADNGLEIASDDGGTSFTFYADGTYRFFFASYSIEDKGTYTYENGVLTVTDVNGKEMTAEGDPLKLHYEYSNNSALNGDYTIPVSDLEALLSGGGESADNGLEIASDDGGTSFTFYADGTYRFFFASYSIEDKGTYTYENGVLTVTDVNGKEMTAEGDPLKLHYEYSNNSALNGDYTIPASDLEALLSGGGESAGSGLEIASDDGGTSFTFYADGTYRFFFASYSIEDKGTYTYENGVLTVTDVNGKEMTAEGDPLKLHYEYSNNSALNGDYTIPAVDLAQIQ